MASELNFFDTYVLMAITEEIVPQQTFFKDRYFPTGEGDIFACDKVLTEYRKGDRKMAAFVSARAGDIPMDRRGYEIHEYQPAFIAPSRLLTLDELRKRGFGEAIYANSTPAQRAARLQLGDLTDMDRRIVRREEWMCAQTMINNACTMQTYIDDKTEGEKLYVKFFDDASDHTYTVATKWNATGGDFFGDVKAMCRKLSSAACARLTWCSALTQPTRSSTWRRCRSCSTAAAASSSVPSTRNSAATMAWSIWVR